MKKIEILGTGCPKCTKMAQNAEEAAKFSGIEYQLNKVTDIMDITNYGVMTTPALVIDGEIKVVGKVPSVEEIKKLIT
jgi:small redox-active disulfide protein 2